MARHLREQGGGHPGDHGPVPELANEPVSPSVGEGFPDRPAHERREGPGGDLSDEQLRDFAARLGLTADTGTAPEPDAPHERDAPASTRPLLVRVRRPVAVVLVAVGRATTMAGDRVRSAGERLRPD